MRMSSPAIGFIGFGEAGSNIAAGLKSAGIERIFAFDIRTNTPDFGPTIQQRAAQSQTKLTSSPQELAESSEVLISTVTASSALQAAQQTAPFLKSKHLYADLNSVSPQLKQSVAKVVTASGAGFVEAAVMAAVPPHRHRVPMLLGGPAAATFAERLSPFGMRFEVLAGKVGTAVAVKMCRSIIVKGLEALLFECVLAAGRFEADERVFASLNESFPGMDWKKLADYMVGRSVVHGERRAREMEEVAETLRGVGIDPIMAEAVARRQDWAGALNLRSVFGSEGPSTYREVVDALTQASKS
jgi:3-hydroxyisobutyrate dehydrogenase-like beta-hydroxyacid dehydrogenase